MPEYTLVYFNLKGRAEIIRWIFEYGDMPYTDERIAFEDWPERKKDIVGGKLPVLMVDDMALTQSMAITRYVAKQAGLVPDDDLQAAYCDALADSVNDVLEEWIKLISSGKSEEETMEEFNEVLYPKFLEPLMTRLDERLQEREWFISDKVTWGDLLITIIMGMVKVTSASLLDNFPALLAHVDKVEDFPKIKEWIEKRPESKF